jgi:hypothetical protein
MGQKTNSTIFSLGLKNAEWKSKYIERNLEESSVLLYKNFEIRNYLNRIFKLHGLLIHSCKIEYNQTTASFLIFFFEKKTETSKLYAQSTKESQEVNALSTSSSFVNSKELINHVINNILAIDLNLFFKNKTVIFKTQNLNQKFELSIKNSKTRMFEYESILKHFKRFLRNPLFKELIKVLFVSVTEKDSAKLIAEAVS